MQNRKLVGITIQFKVFFSAIGMLILAACSGGNYLLGSAGVGGCNLSGDSKAISNGKPIIYADAGYKTVKVIRWDGSSESWMAGGHIQYREADPKTFRVPNQYLTTGHWFSIVGCTNWYSAQELLGPLVSDVGTSSPDPNDGIVIDPDGDPSGASDTTDPSCLDSSTSETSECPVDSSGSGGGGAYGD